MNNLIVKWNKVLFENKTQSPLIAWINLGNGTMFRIFSFYADSPRHGLMVGIDRVGCFFFDTKNKWKEWEYVSGKLYLPQADARNMADWINVQIHDEDEPFKYQGHYEKEYIKSVNKYGLIGEVCSMPLYPEIIS